MNKVDCFLPSSPKDFSKLPFAVDGLAKNVKELNDIHICIPAITTQKDYEIDGHKVIWHEDFEVFPLLASIIPHLRFRPNWIGTQLTKLLQTATKTDDVLVWDADCILLRPLELYKDGKKKLFEQPNLNDEAGFIRYISRLSGGELCQWTNDEKCQTRFIADHAFWRQSWIKEMISRYFPSLSDFIQFTVLNTYWRHDDKQHSIFISEYECIGQFENKFHSDDVVIEHLRKKQIDKNQWSQKENHWSDEEISHEIYDARVENAYILKLQSNSPMSDVGWKLSSKTV